MLDMLLCILYQINVILIFNSVSAMTRVVTAWTCAQTCHACISTVRVPDTPTRPGCVRPSGETCHVSVASFMSVLCQVST